MSRCLSLCWTAGLAVSVLAAPALGGLPAVLDRVPAGAPVVIAMSSVESFRKGSETLANSLNVPMDFGPLTPMLENEGLNASGSAAMVMLSAPSDENEEGTMVVLVPVSDYAKFVTGLGGQAGGGIQALSIEGRDVYVEDAGGGYALSSDKKETLEAFDAPKGQMGAHTKALGVVGGRIAEANNTLVIADVAALKPQLESALSGLKEQMEQVQAMGGPAMGNAAVIDAAAQGFLRDGQVGVIGLNVGDSGLAIDIGAQFKEGSEVAGFFAAAGKAGELLGRLPGDAYLVAATVDTSAPGLKKIFANLTALAAEGQDVVQGMNFTKFVEQTDGTAMVMGVPPGGLMGGLFLSTSIYYKTSKPAELAGAMKDALTQLNGKTVQGMTYTTEYAPGAANVDGVKADTWSMRMQFDPDQPTAQQMQMMMMSMFGPTGGPAGYVAQADGGVVMTYAQNPQTLSKALAAAKGGAGLGSDAGVKAMLASMPAGRSMEGYVNVKAILDLALPMAAMFIGPVNVQIPADLKPVAFAGTTDAGGVMVRTIVPADVMKTVRDIGQSIQQAQQQQFEQMDDEGGEDEPRF